MSGVASVGARLQPLQLRDAAAGGDHPLTTNTSTSSSSMSSREVVAPSPTDSGLGTPTVSSASTASGDSSAGSSGRRRRAMQPLRNSSDTDDDDNDNDTADDTSSCASGPAYAGRQPGFARHAHSQLAAQYGGAHARPTGRRKEKRPALQADRQPHLPAVATNVPMRQRHLPTSIWQEPDTANYSPATTAALPRLPLHRSVDDIADCSTLSTSPSKSGGGLGVRVAGRSVWTIQHLDTGEALQRLFDAALKPPTAAAAAAAGDTRRNAAAAAWQRDRLQPLRHHRPPANSKCSFISSNDPCLSETSRFPNLSRCPLPQVAAATASTATGGGAEGCELQRALPQLHYDTASQLLGEVAKQL